MQDPTYLPAAQVRARYGVSDMSLWRWLKNEDLAFPHPIKSTTVASGANDLEAWEASRTGGADARTA